MRYSKHPRSSNGPLHIDAKLNHIDVCGGGLFCQQCGRRGCTGCITQDSFTNRRERLNSIGKCPICNGGFKEHKILLFPRPDDDWDLDENY